MFWCGGGECLCSGVVEVSVCVLVWWRCVCSGVVEVSVCSGVVEVSVLVWWR